MILQGSAKYPVDEIIIHCSATRKDWMANQSLSEKRAEIRRWHMQDRGWKDIGYHWLIDRDGEVAAGRPETVIGAHTVGHNTGTIGICLIGGFGGAADDKFDEHFTPQQKSALLRLVKEIRARAKIRHVSGHNEYAVKACPSFTVSEIIR